MESRAKLFGHPIHPMLIVFPAGLLITSVIFDIMALTMHTPLFAQIATYLIAAGVIGGLAAALFGAIDWFAIPMGTRAKSVGLLHGVGNVMVVTLFGIGWLLRRDTPDAPGTIPITLSCIGFLLMLVTGWLGGELVDRLRVGVDDGANVNAPSSLSGQPATETASEFTARTHVGEPPPAEVKETPTTRV